MQQVRPTPKPLVRRARVDSERHKELCEVGGIRGERGEKKNFFGKRVSNRSPGHVRHRKKGDGWCRSRRSLESQEEKEEGISSYDALKSSM